VAVAVATLTRGAARKAEAVELPSSPPGLRSIAARVGAAGLVIASYVQLVAGAQLRHLDASIDPITFRWLVAFHVAGALVVAVLAFLLAWAHAEKPSALRRWSWLLATAVSCQILLGIGAWVVSWGLPNGLLPASWELSQPILARSTAAASVVTGHVVLGMLILGAAVVAWILGGGLVAETPARRAGVERAFA
jgi:heme A synthase